VSSVRRMNESVRARGKLFGGAGKIGEKRRKMEAKWRQKGQSNINEGNKGQAREQ